MDTGTLLDQNWKTQIKHCLGENNPVSEQTKENGVRYVQNWALKNKEMQYTKTQRACM